MEETNYVSGDASHKPYAQKSPMVGQKRKNLSKPRLLGYTTSIIITTDDRMKGWVAHCRQTSVKARWSFPAKGIVSYILEIPAAFLAMTALTAQIKNKLVLLRMDNRAAVSYTKRQPVLIEGGGTYHVMLIDLKTVYLPG